MPEGTHAEAGAEQATGAPTISLPKGGGTLRGIGERFSTNPATGTASFGVPVATAPGRAGFGPSLSLSYDSGFGNGPFGFGWRLSPGTIARKTDAGVPRYEDALASDTFVLSGADELVRAATPAVERLGHLVERYRPRVERDFTRVERWTRLADGDMHWRTISRDNVVTVYGWDAGSRIADPEHPERVFSWLACHSYDDRGNAIIYEYTAEDAANVDLAAAAEQGRARGANRYLKRVRYGNRGPLLVDPATPSFRRPHLPPPDFGAADWMFEVVFDYGEGHYAEQPPDADGRVFASASAAAPTGTAWPARTDAFSSYRAGFEVRTHRLCRRVLVFHRFPVELGPAACLVRAIELTYCEKLAGSFVVRIVQSGYRRQPDGLYLKRSMPALELGYSESPLEDDAYEGPDVRELDEESLENLPVALDAHHQWIDLDGDGIAGVLSRENGAWRYKPNLGDGRLGPARVLDARPSLDDGGRQLPLDLVGDGTLDMVWLADPAPGYNARAVDGGFEPFQPFESSPGIDGRDPRVRLVDVVGDGLADMLMAEGDCLRWHRSLGKQGFGAALRVELPHDEDDAPRVVFADPLQSVFLADMSGDGLADIVRVSDSEVCYWPSLGYGRFGAKVTMDGAPTLEPPELFDPRRVRLADTDGSGTADIVYLGADAVRVYLNLSGNAWSAARVLRQAPATNGATTTTVGDLLGRGTACLIWSSALPGEARQPVRYLDLMDGVKPHLLVEIKNNMGAETRVKYATSTKFHLSDKAAGTPWRTRLRFPVHVVERIDTLDRVGRNRYVTRYSYHHGHFDGEAREFRGFGRVDRLDTEELAALTESGEIPDAENIDAASYVPPVLTRTWFHTGASASLSGEFWSGKSISQTLPAGLSASETRDARRALTGVPLRYEVYGLDGLRAAEQPYAVRDHSYTVRRHEAGVYSAREREAIDFQYDRDLPDDPRVTHRLDLEADDFGNVLLSASVAYGRRAAAPADPLLTPADVALQRASHVTFTATGVTNAVSLEDAHRAPRESERRVFELRNVAPAGDLFQPTELATLIATASDGAHDLPYEDVDDAGVAGGDPLRRRIEHVRTLYRANDLTAALLLGQLESLALPEISYRLAFTPELATHVYVASGKLSQASLDALLGGPAGYVHAAGDPGWWVPSNRITYSPDPIDGPAQELARAVAHFFVPRRFTDPLGAATRLDLDAHDLMPVESVDALGNRVYAANDYRVLQPAVVTDANGNESAVAYDALGEIAGTALMGKQSEAVGDSLAGFDPDLAEAAVAAHLADPTANPHAVLGRATTRRIAVPSAQPAVVCTLARETHDADLKAAGQAAVQHRLVYSDGLGNKIQEKRFTGPGRWLSSGWTVLDNKGRPVRRYEPFYDNTPAFRFGAAVGVSAIRFYDPLGHIAAIAHPHKAWEKALAGPWRTEHWDVNDTLLLDPKTDADAGAYFSRLPDAEYLPTWHPRRIGGGLGADEQEAARKTEVHAGTPTVDFHDALGRRFLTVEHNRFKRSSDPSMDPPLEQRYRALVVHDVEGNERRLVDAAGRVCARYEYDIAGNRISAATMENGERRMLADVLGNPIRAWDARGHDLTVTYDALRRPLTRSVRGTDPARSDPRTLTGTVAFERLEYGEGLPNDVAANLRTRLVRTCDGAGVVKRDLYDFKGNCLRSERRLLQEYDALADWSASPPLEGESFVNRTSYDALNRVTTVTTPDGSVAHLGYDPLDRLTALEVNVRGAAAATPFVTGVEYDARGQRTRIDYGNGVRTDYEHDPETFRLARQHTTRAPGGNGFAARIFADPATLQDLRYAYDPVGNVVKLADRALRTVVASGQPVSAEVANDYDAVYRLIEAGGREQSDPADVEALRRYSERYEYDAVGNLLRLAHRAGGGNWQRDYEYSEPSQLEPARMSNRLTRAPVGGAVAPAIAYDQHGCMTRMTHLPLMRWDFKDRLTATARQVAEDPEAVFYAYDDTGARIRKVVRRQNGTRRSERIYLLGCEVYREYGADGMTVSMRRDALHVLDDRSRIALVETVPGSSPVIRYQLANHLGSACVEADAAGAVISYEEFTPFGSQAVHGGRAAAEVSLKRYRYTGKELDPETGLAYYGARYYAPWLGRWTSCDPEGFAPPRAGPGPRSREDEWPRGWNLYAYARNSPYVYNDPTGRIDTRTVVSIAVVAAPLLALLGVGSVLQLAGVPVPGSSAENPGRWVDLKEGALFDLWAFFHYGVPALIGLGVAAALSGTGLRPEETYLIAGLAGTTVAYVYEIFERPLWAWAHQRVLEMSHSSNGLLRWFSNLVIGGTRDAALEWRTNTMEDVLLGSLGAFTAAALLLWHKNRPPDLGFALLLGAGAQLFFFGLSYSLVYGGAIPTRDTHGYDPVRNEFYLRESRRTSERLDPSYSPLEERVVA